MKPGAIIPFAFFSGSHDGTKWFYSALTDCDVCVLPINQLMKELETYNHLTIDIMNWFSQEVHELLVRLSSLGKTNTDDKLIAALKFLATLHATKRPSGWLRVNFPVSHQLLADMTGTTRESTALSMKTFKDKGFIRNPRMTILEINLDHIPEEQGNS